MSSAPTTPAPTTSASGQRQTFNPFNLTLRAQRDSLRGAWRHPLVPGCGPAQAAAQAAAAAAPSTPPSNPTQRRSSLVHIPIVVNTSGDNILIPPSLGRKLIYEIVIWNVASQSLSFYQGPSATGILKLKLTSFPALTGLTLPFAGNWEFPHWEIDDGQPLVMNLGSNAEVDGFIKYRVANTSF
jgi:hypothetical protein